jgi:hypothetical protein
MKKLIFSLAVSLVVLSASAGRMPSELNVRLYDNSLFTVVFDGQLYDQLSPSFTAANLRPGNHYMKVFRYHGSNGWYPAYNEVIYVGFVNVGPSKIIYGMISAERRFIILDEVALFPAHHDYGNHYGNNNAGNDQNEYNNDGYNGGSYNASYMNDADFNILKNMVGNASFDDTKLTLCKQAISSNYICSAQVYELMTLMTFESNKLEFAKYAYKSVVDKNKYFMVNDAFTFSSSIDELNDYINGH